MNFVFMLSLLFPSLQFERIESSEYVRVSFVVHNSRLFWTYPSDLLTNVLSLTSVTYLLCWIGLSPAFVRVLAQASPPCQIIFGK